MNKRFVVVVLDSFGVGAMDDVAQVRPQDIGSNTALHLLNQPIRKKWDTLVSLGLMNTLKCETQTYKMNQSAKFGIAKLKHVGADTFFGHQELMGTLPQTPIKMKLSQIIDTLEADLINMNYQTMRYTKEGHQLLSVNQCVFIGDNMETDLGQAINVIGSLDLCSFDFIKAIGHIVRKHVQVPRVIAFGGRGVTYQDLVDHIITKSGYIGVDAPASGVYQQDYHVVHIGYGVDTTVQIPALFKAHHIPVYLYGKVADIVENSYGKNYPCVETERAFEALLSDLKEETNGFFCLNVQETDLAGHAQDSARYIDRLNVSDAYLKQVIDVLDDKDILIVMADHGNDPTCGHSKHTRENVPILIYTTKNEGIDIGVRETLADVGATVADFFGVSLSYGTSFYSLIK